MSFFQLDMKPIRIVQDTKFVRLGVRSDLNPLQRSLNQAYYKKNKCSSRYGRFQTHCLSSASAQPVSQEEPKNGLTFISSIAKFVWDQFLPIGLVLGMIGGGLFPKPALVANEIGLMKYTTAGIFVISGLRLRRAEAMKAISSWGACLFGILSILVLTPVTAFPVSKIPVHPPELVLGLAVFSCMPTTLSSGISLTQAVGGNTALALLLTISTNVIGVFTMPFFVSAVVQASGVRIDPVPLLINLIKTILVPTMFGASIRAIFPTIRKKVDESKEFLSFLTTCFLITVPWVQIALAVEQNVQVSLGSLLIVTVLSVLIHLVWLIFNIINVSIFGFGGDGEDGIKIRRALVLVGSQKTLPVAVTTLQQLGATLSGSMGLAVIPCVMTHFGQILIDSFVVQFWINSDRKRKAAKQA
eukprot:TRINITY_DN3022_c0_g2_i1.p2 TRINITY_DN3022_c0_g2~~TRINITY_DN3022_c0_g2_i1.p2  ORF type:complete len:458 (-),score=31.59 TRINITY_DN3022_c0_g2_i1:256-1497(-)